MNIVSSTSEIAQPSESEGPSYGTISLLGWAHFLNDGAANYLPGILSAILVSLGLSVSMAGTLMGALLAGQALQPLTGLLSDRIGGRAFIIFGLACTSLAAALIAFAQTFATLVIVLLLLGVANAAFHPQTLASVRLASGKRVGTGLSVFLIGGEIGRGIWPLLASLLVTVRGVGGLWVLGIPALLTLPILWRRAPSVPPRTKDAARVQWSEHMRPLALLVVFSSLRGVLLYAISAFVPILWHAHGGSLAGGAGFITVLMLAD